jgi:RNA polymerase sigma-70 factor (ECF subfamily)
MPGMFTITAADQLSVPEAELIRLSLEGDSQAFSELVKPYRPMFYKKALSIVRNESDAEDVTQTALLKAFRKLSQFRLDAQFRTWTTSIVINEALMCLRASRRFKQESLDREEREDGSSPIDIPDPRENPSQVFEKKELRGAILKGVFLLPSLLRSVFILRDLRLLSISDTAKTLGITETCVKTRLRRARLQLQESLAHFRGAHRTVNGEVSQITQTVSQLRTIERSMVLDWGPTLLRG